jgi:NAD(P)-dependent dehydrogenase (short-subunit alcohol dehydrogenase family)
MVRRIAFGLAILLVSPCFAQAPGASGQKAVLVTGASSGIGRKITERLAADGHYVYAGARKEVDLKDLAAIKNVQAVKLDVTDAKDIAAAVEIVNKGGRGLYAIVNNAGIGTLGPVIQTGKDELELTMAVNVYGPYRVTQAFGPLVIAQKGRVTTIGSISGFLAGPATSVYAMSKHAVEAFTDSLAQELQPAGVHVSVVEPGNYNSEIAANAVARLGVQSPLADRSKFKDPDEVAAAVSHALFVPNPKRRYLVVPVEGEADRTIRKQIARLVELNEGHAFTYDRDTLVRMLDEALAKSRPRVASTGSAQTSKPQP